MAPPMKGTGTAAAVAYDATGIHQAEFVYSSPVSSLLGLHDINKCIHSIQSLPLPVEFVIFLFGYAFNPVSIPLWMIAASLLGAAPSSILYQSTNIIQQPQDEVLAQMPFIYAPAFYLSTVLVTLIATEISKASVRATRPEAILSKRFRSSKVRRFGTLVSSLKSKHSFPSGDSAQAMNVVLVLYYYVIPSMAWFLDTSNDKSNYVWTIIHALAFGVFYPGVAFARIFYHCHWIEDCLGGAILATALHKTVIPAVSNLVWRAVEQLLTY